MFAADSSPRMSAVRHGTEPGGMAYLRSSPMMMSSLAATVTFPCTTPLNTTRPLT